MKSFGARVLALLVLAVVASACGGTGPPPQPAKSSDQPAITGAPAGFNADDVAFANDVLSSHGQSAELSALVPERSANSKLIALAADLTTGQAPQLEMMKVFLVQWSENPDIGKKQGGQGEVEKGIVDDPTVERLKALNGKDFDELWLQSMIGHLQGTVAMAEAELAHGSNVDAIATARQITVTERARIVQMQNLLGNG